MALHGADRDEEPRRDLSVGQVLPDSSEHLGLAGRNTDLVCCHVARPPTPWTALTCSDGRGGGIRTRGLLLPEQARYPSCATPRWVPEAYPGPGPGHRCLGRETGQERQYRLGQQRRRGLVVGRQAAVGEQMLVAWVRPCAWWKRITSVIALPPSAGRRPPGWVRPVPYPPAAALPAAGGPYRSRMTLPVMSRAASEARYATTPATSAGEATVNSTVLSATIWRTASLTQPVSVTPG